MQTAEQLDKEARRLAAWVVHRDLAIQAALDALNAPSNRKLTTRVQLATSILSNALQSHPTDVTLV